MRGGLPRAPPSLLQGLVPQRDILLALCAQRLSQRPSFVGPWTFPPALLFPGLKVKMGMAGWGALVGSPSLDKTQQPTCTLTPTTSGFLP